MSGKYILHGHLAVLEPDLLTWAKWFESADRQVAHTYTCKGKVRISTVFLGLDHSFGHGRPLLFETMVFGGSLDEEQEHCSTWEEAEIMHNQMIEKVKQSEGTPCEPPTPMK